MLFLKKKKTHSSLFATQNTRCLMRLYKRAHKTHGTILTLTFYLLFAAFFPHSIFKSLAFLWIILPNIDLLYKFSGSNCQTVPCQFLFSEHLFVDVWCHTTLEFSIKNENTNYHNKKNSIYSLDT